MFCWAGIPVGSRAALTGRRHPPYSRQTHRRRPHLPADRRSPPSAPRRSTATAPRSSTSSNCAIESTSPATPSASGGHAELPGVSAVETEDATTGSDLHSAVSSIERVEQFHQRLGRAAATLRQSEAERTQPVSTDREQKR